MLIEPSSNTDLPVPYTSSSKKKRLRFSSFHSASVPQISYKVTTPPFKVEIEERAGTKKFQKTSSRLFIELHES